MRIVGLISGGKDSLFNLMECVRNGHEIVALANIVPDFNGNEDLNSYMYQTVGHEGVESIANAMEIPLFRQATKGVAKCLTLEYDKNISLEESYDEVEDLFQLLSKIKNKIDFDGVSVGAIESTYQNKRVSNVCDRLNLVCYGYLWQRNQYDLLKEMLESQMKIVVIKIASMGLNERAILGHQIDMEMLAYFKTLADRFGFNVCGEGGEYETFVLDCPLYKHTLTLEKFDIKKDKQDENVGYLVLNEIKSCPK